MKTQQKRSLRGLSHLWALCLSSLFLFEVAGFTAVEARGAGYSGFGPGYSTAVHGYGALGIHGFSGGYSANTATNTTQADSAAPNKVTQENAHGTNYSTLQNIQGR